MRGYNNLTAAIRAHMDANPVSPDLEKGKIERTDWLIDINGDMARAKFMEHLYAPDGRYIPLHNIRVLDKTEKGDWKISSTIAMADFTKATDIKHANASTDELAIKTLYQQICKGFEKSDFTPYYALLDENVIVINEMGKELEGNKKVQQYFT